MTNIFIMAGLFNMKANWFFDIFRWGLALIDTIVYFVISIFFRTIFNLANFELIGLYEIFEKRIYVILGIFMLFKVTVSLITYLVNPDKISDKEQGMAKVVTRIITVLVMLIALPTFFNLMTEFQNKLLPVVPRVIMGTANTLSSDDVGGIASNMSLTLLQGFAHYKEECKSPGSSSVWDNQSTDDNQSTESLSKLSDFLDHVNDTCVYNGKKIYAYDYLPIISTVVGIIMIYVLFSLCITVAIRAFKLIILRMLAPIPVVSYIDPKSSKDGMFSIWTKTFMSVWVELFILLGTIYFIVYMLDFMLSAGFWSGFFSGLQSEGFWAVVDGTFLVAFLVVGLLMFAKQAPKFIFDALGIKTKGSFTRMLGMGATALGMGGAIASRIKAGNEYNRNNPIEGTGFKNNAKRLFRNVGNVGGGILGGIGATAAGGNALLSSDKPTLMTGFDAMAKNNATALSRINAGSTASGRGKARMQMLFGGETKYDTLNRELSANKEANSAIGAWISGSKQKALDADDHGPKGILVDVYGHTGLNYKTLKANIESAQKGDQAAMQYLIDKGFVNTIDVEEEFMEEYDVTKQVGTGIYDANGKEIMKTVTEKATRPATRTVQKQVADWQSAFSILTDVEDKQVNEHMYRIASKTYTDVNGNEQQGGSSYDGANYDKYERATHAMKGLSAKDKNGNTMYDIEFTVGNTNNELLGTSKKMAGATSENQRYIEQNATFEAAKVDAKEAKK